jgi:hypothetical protein
MWAVELSTALMTLPLFPGSDILDMIAQVCTECMSCPEGTMASGFIVRSGCITHIANRGSIATSNDTKDDGCYGTPAALVLRDTVRSSAIGGSMSDMTTAKVLVAP